jgi:hypothetical protein|uniref:Uncharacterized protein n=1 Tax=viral metagenome TaxID=1070528 RepID=A0A6C0ETC6_9ZZZZ
MDNINELIISSMEIAQHNELDNKKEYVLNIIKLSLKHDTYERYYPLISVMIDLIKSISKNQDLLKGLVINKGIFKSCFK